MQREITLARSDGPIAPKFRIRVMMRIFLLLPLTLIAGPRVIVGNVVHINKDILTVLLICGFTAFAARSYYLRFLERRSDFAVIDVLVGFQFAVALIASLAYIALGISVPGDAAYGIYYYALSPLLLYAGFSIARITPDWRRALYWSCLITYTIMLTAGVCEVLGVDFWLFENERFVVQRNFLGMARASGLYGTQIDFGCLSFIYFSYTYLLAWTSKQKRHGLVGLLAVLGVLLSGSRVWLLATSVVLLIPILKVRSVKKVIVSAVIVTLLATALVPVINTLGLIDVVLSRDEVSQNSNADRSYYLRHAPRWLIDDYAIVGTGPGTQTGPDSQGKKIIGDFLWLAILVDYGTILGIVIVGLRLSLLAVVFRRSWVRRRINLAQILACTLCAAQFLASFVDSAFAHITTLSIFYLVAGIALHDTNRLNSEPAPSMVF